MSIFLKLLGKEEIKYFRTQKQPFNPPKKSQANSKLNDNNNNIFFNHKRNENNIIPLSKRHTKNKEAKFQSKKIFKIINMNNSNLQEKINKTSININKVNELNELNENKENIPYLNEQN